MSNTFERFSSLFSSPKKEPEKVQSTPTTTLSNFIFSQSAIDPPNFKENTNRGIVEYGSGNRFPSLLLELLNTCALHNGIVVGKSRLSAGDRFTVEGVTVEEWAKTAPVNEAANLLSFIENKYDENWYDLKEKLALDWIISGSFVLKVTWSPNFSRIASVSYVPWEQVTVGIDEDGEVNRYLISEKRDRYSKMVSYQPFDTNAQLINGTLPDEYSSIDEYPYDHEQIMFVKNHWNGYKYYGRPGYIGSLTAIKSSAVLSNFFLSSIENGFTPSFIVNFNEKPLSTEQGKEITADWRKQFTASGQGRKLGVVFSNSKETAPTFHTLDVKNVDQQLVALQKDLFYTITSGHSVTSPELVGIPVQGSMLSGDSFEEKWKLFYTQTISFDKAVIERTFNRLASINGVKDIVRIAERKPF